MSSECSAKVIRFFFDLDCQKVCCSSPNSASLVGVGGVAGATFAASFGGRSFVVSVEGAAVSFAAGNQGPDGDGIAACADSSGRGVPSSAYRTVGASIEFGDGMCAGVCVCIFT